MSKQYSPDNGCSTDFLSFALGAVRELFEFKADGRTKHGPEELAVAVLLMCTLNTSAETVQAVDGLLSADRILARIGKEEALTIGENINRMLKKRLSAVRFSRTGKITVAGDITENPFYGDKEQSHAMGGKPKAGTSYFVKYLTFSLVVEGHRFPVGFYPLTEERLQWVPEIVADEVTWLQERDLCDRIVLDRGFNGFDTYNLIDDRGGKFLMPLKRNDKLKEVFTKREPSITRRERKHGFVLQGYYPAAWNTGYHILAVRIKPRKGKNKEKWRWVLFITNMNIRPGTARFIYKKRWGIETAYSQINTLKAFTKSRKHGVRVFLTGLAFLLFSIWIFINWRLTRQYQRKKANLLARGGTVRRKDFRIIMTLPRFRLTLLLAILDHIGRKREN